MSSGRSSRALRRWNDLSDRQRGTIITAAVLETVLKIAMLADLRHRPSSQVRGPKWLWAASALINSAGVVPLAYFVVGRQRPGADPG